MLHKEKAKQCKNPLSKACSARMEGFKEQQQKEPLQRRAAVYFIFADWVWEWGEEEKDEGER